MADVAWNPRKAGLKHQDADAGAVNRLAAMRLVAIRISHPRFSLAHRICASTVAMILRTGECVYGRNLAAFVPRVTMILSKARVRKKPITDGRGICEPNCRRCRSSPRSQPL